MLDRKTTTVEVTSLRPLRNTIISKDEITGLTIDLNLLTVEEFIQKYWG